MAHDLIIRGGTVVDGTGAAPRLADVAVDDGVITTVGDLTGVAATEEIDATGRLVTPGFVDIHTHYDGQATWDSELAPSAWHGVTTLVMGNCGVGFAPVRPGQEEWLIGLMEGVEDIPGTALSEGITWSWETFPEYLDALDQLEWTVDVGTQVPHGAVRAYVMGERGAKNEPATPDDIEQMAEIVREAVAAGALGFSTSRTIVHVAIDGEPVPGTFAAEDELFGIGRALGDLGKGLIELAPAGAAGEDVVSPEKEVDWMVRLSAETGRPVTFALLQVNDAPDLWQKLLDLCSRAAADGAQVFPQVPGRPFGLLSGHQTTYNILDAVPAYTELKAQGLPFEQLVDRLADPDVRASIVDGDLDDETRKRLDDAYAMTYVIGTPPDYEPGPEKTIVAVAEANGVTPLEAVYDALLEDEGRAMLMVPFLNYSRGNSDHNREMLLNDQAVLGLSDGGAHVGIICDASTPTTNLAHWTRDRTRGEQIPLEFIVHKQTQATAELFGFGDRGVVAPGYRADLNVIDHDRIQVDNPVMHHDLPAGGKRLLQRSVGYDATICNGVVTYRNGTDTGARPGRLVRGAQPAPSA